LEVFSPYINDYNLLGNQIIPGGNIFYPGPTSTVNNITWGSPNYTGGVWTIGAGVPFKSVSGLQDITSAHRIVSAALYVQPEVALANNSGEYTLYALPFDGNIGGDYDDYANTYKAICVPLSTSPNSAVVKWYPVARQDWSFKNFQTTKGIVPSIDDDAPLCFPFWTLGFITNCPANLTFRVTVVVNYEFIPLNNVLNVLDTSPSPQDTQEVDLVERWVQDMPVAEPVSPKKVSSSPSTVNPAHGENDAGTGFGMAFNVIKELAPIALALL